MGRTSDARERLVQATIDLMWPSSYGAVSVDAICDKAGVKKGSFYHFFASKDDLVVAALDAHWSVRRPLFDEMFAPSRPPLDRLRRYFAHVVERQNAVREDYGHVLGCFHNSVATECIQSPPMVAAKVQEILATKRRYFETALRDAHADGVVREGDPESDARAVYALAEGALMQARIHDDLDILRRLQASAFALLGVVDETAANAKVKAKSATRGKSARA